MTCHRLRLCSDLLIEWEQYIHTAGFGNAHGPAKSLTGLNFWRNATQRHPVRRRVGQSHACKRALPRDHT